MFTIISPDYHEIYLGIFVILSTSLFVVINLSRLKYDFLKRLREAYEKYMFLFQILSVISLIFLILTIFSHPAASGL